MAGNLGSMIRGTTAKNQARKKRQGTQKRLGAKVTAGGYVTGDKRNKRKRTSGIGTALAAGRHRASTVLSTKRKK